MKLFWLFIMFVSFYSCLINAQSLTELEEIYYAQQASLQKEQKNLDSLQLNLKTRANQIDAEKSKTNPDEDRIKYMMSSSISLTNNIELLQNKTTEIKQKINMTGKKLSEKYSVVIDSLKALEKTNNINFDNLIFSYTLKKLIVSPEVNQLSFNPKKILDFDLKNSKDSLNKNLYEDYLQNALTEVNDYLTNVKELNSEVDEIIKLQKKTKEFLEEIDFDNRINPRPLASGRNLESSFTDKDNLQAISLRQRLSEYNLLLNQLSIIKSINIQNKIRTTFETKNNNVNLYEYQKLLKEVKKGLEEYKSALEHKLNPSK